MITLFTYVKRYKG